MKILAIETSCDDTCAAVLDNDRILSNVISSQIDLHKNWGGVVPDIAKRAHTERIWPVIITALIRAKIPITKKQEPNKLQLPNFNNQTEKIIENHIRDIDTIAVTKGPGLAVALGVGIGAAKEIAIKYKKKVVAVNHIEGHILSNFTKNRNGTPKRKIKFPALTLTVSGGHTFLILVEDIGKYTVIGETLDDAGGEALDKASKLLGLGYPGGPVIERLAKNGDEEFLELPRPMRSFKTFDYSFSGLKTSFYYKIKDWPKEKIEKNLSNLAASYQRAVFDSLIGKYRLAIEKYKPKTLLGSGGVMANLVLRKNLREVAKEAGLPIFMPFKKELNTDNAAMIGVAAYYKALRGEFVENLQDLEREPRMKI